MKGYTMEVSPSVAGGSTRRFDVDGMLPMPLTRSWCATGFSLTKHRGLYVVGLFDNFLIVFHALRPLCITLVCVMTSSHLPLLSSIILSRFYGAASKWLLLYASYRLLIGEFYRERLLLDILLVWAF